MDEISICHVTYSGFPEAGSSTIYEYPLAEARHGLNVSVISLQSNESSKQREIVKGVTVYRIPRQSSSGSKTSLFSFILSATKIIRDNHFDVVHLYNTLGIMAPLLRVVSRPFRNQAVWIRDFRSAPVSTRKRLLPLRPTESLLSLQAIFFDATFCQSEGTRDKIFGENTSNIFIARQGANLELFKRTKQNLTDLGLAELEGSFILIYIGGLTTQRDCKRLLHAMRIAVNELGNEIKLLIIGDGNERQNLQALTQELELTKQIMFYGQVDYRSIPRYLSIADIGLAYVPATRVLGAQPPLKTVEMLACDLPVLATDTRGNRHFIQDQCNGILVQDKPEPLGNAIIELVHNKELRNELAQNARSSICQYDYANIVGTAIIPKYLDLLRQKKA